MLINTMETSAYRHATNNSNNNRNENGYELNPSCCVHVQRFNAIDLIAVATNLKGELKAHEK